jgi:hypothetical protein
MGDRFGDILTRGVEAVTHDAPPCAEMMSRALRPIPLELIVDGQSHVLTVDGERIQVAPSVGITTVPSRIRVTTTSAEVLGLLDGDDEILPAIVANRVRVTAPYQHVHRLFEVLRAFVEGCARSSSAAELLADVRWHVAERSCHACHRE